MKPSHFQTPRTLGESTFYPDMNPVAHYRPADRHDVIVVVGCIIALVCMVLILTMGG